MKTIKLIHKHVHTKRSNLHSTFTFEELLFKVALSRRSLQIQPQIIHYQEIFGLASRYIVPSLRIDKLIEKTKRAMQVRTLWSIAVNGLLHANRVTLRIQLNLTSL